MKNKISIIPLFLLICGAARCQDKMEMHQLINTYFDALNRHDSVTVSNLYADSAVLESSNWEGEKKGIPGAREVYGRYFTSSPDLKYIITHIFIDGNTAVVEYTSNGTITKLEPAVPEYMRGRRYALKNITRFTIKNRKIAQSITYFDQLSFLRQAGFFEQKN